MTRATLYCRNLGHHWRLHVAVALGVAAGSAVLTGALLVGDSLRGTLRAAALERLGPVTYAIESPAFFRAALADELGGDAGLRAAQANVAPVILARGSARQPDTQAAAHRVSVFGVDARFWQLGGGGGAQATASERGVVLNQALADVLGVRPGDDVLLRIHKPAAISPEMLFGRRDELGVSLRLTVAAVIPNRGSGGFALRPQAGVSRNAFVPLATLQRALEQRDQANAILATGSAREDGDRLQAALDRHVALADLGLRLRVDEDRHYVSLESTTYLLAPPVEAAARAAASALGVQTTPIMAYLANSISVVGRPDIEVPYSTVVALDPAAEMWDRLPFEPLAAVRPPLLHSGEIVLNDWTARELQARVGNTIRLSYFAAGPFGQLATRTADFRLAAIVALAGPAADAGLAPEYPGVTDTQRVADWNPPFPLDLKRVRPQDEAYWQAHRATPKAFVPLSDGVRLWAEQPERLGRLTALRIHADADGSPATLGQRFQDELLRQLDPAQRPLHVTAVRAQALAASHGATDFAQLFVGFSLFLIVSAALLVTLLFRLGIERRAREVGLLLAAGWAPGRVRRLLLAEGLTIAAIGAAGGLLAARGYLWLMLAGLRSWWSAAVTTSSLGAYASISSYAAGYVASVLLGAIAIVWALRGLARQPARALLAGQVTMGSDGTQRRRRGYARWIAAGAALVGGGCVVAGMWKVALGPAAAFYLAGAAWLIAGLAAFAAWLAGSERVAAHIAGRAALVRLGVRNARRHAGRSLLTAALLATATFVIVALQALRVAAPTDSSNRHSGTGGFALLAESDIPLLYDLNSPAGRTALNMTEPEFAADGAHAAVRFVPFRRHAGDDASCLNLYAPAQPTVLGATDAMIDRGGFDFAALANPTAAEQANPWLMLRRPPAAGLIPAIMDEAAARWQLHLDLGADLVVTSERGDTVRLRLVAWLKGSVLQGQAIISESNFVRLFPSVTGYALQLIEAPPAQVPAVRRWLEHDLADFGLAATPTVQRLTELLAVQNTYLLTFQQLGGVGLMLGTIGLAAVMLRNVLERRAELALLRTVGFSPAALSLLVLVENAFLVSVGLAIGLGCAAVAVLPTALARGPSLPWAQTVLIVAAVLITGLAASWLALRAAWRAPLLAALRAE